VQPDGRYHLELVGVRRVAVDREWEVDGYRVCQPSLLSDAPPEHDLTELCQAGAGSGGAGGRHAVQHSSSPRARHPDPQELERKTDAALEALRRAVQLTTGYERLRRTSRLQEIGEKPPLRDAEAFSFWAASLFTLDRHAKLKVLMCTSTEERLTLLLARTGMEGCPVC